MESVPLASFSVRTTVGRFDTPKQTALRASSGQQATMHSTASLQQTGELLASQSEAKYARHD